jgi:thiosulfate dehydrogenase
MLRILAMIILIAGCTRTVGPAPVAPLSVDALIAQVPEGPLKKEILYGRDLIFDTPLLIGPKGKVKAYTGNRMACKSCHMDGGIRDFGLSMKDTHGLYPQYRSREGRILNLAERINNCVENPMLGVALPVASREMQAMQLYIRFLGQGRPVLAVDRDDRMPKIEWPNTAASPERGRKIYANICARCHGPDGAGVENPDKTAYIYPPLWGPESYRIGSSMQRVGILARFIKANMPFGEASAAKPVLSDMEALDVAAFVNADNLNPRPGPYPGRVLFPSPEFKPFDSPIPPYADPFPPDQHKFGPFPAIIQFHAEKRKYSRPTDGDLNGP